MSGEYQDWWAIGVSLRRVRVIRLDRRRRFFVASATEIGKKRIAFRVNKLPSVWEGGFWTKDLAIRRRIDGGYAVAHGSLVEYQIDPDSFRNFLDFLPHLKNEEMRIKQLFTKKFFRE